MVERHLRATTKKRLRTAIARKRFTLLVVVVVAVVFAVGGLVAARFIKSPEQAAAERQAPAAGPVTVPVERRVVRDTLVLRGRVEQSAAVDVRYRGSAREGAAVVTRTPIAAGERVSAGNAVVEVSGRPVLVLPGTVPAYRDLLPGSEGNDVKQLQEALAALGHRTAGDKAGSFGSATKGAVTALYAKAGYEPTPARPDGDEQLVAAQRRVRDAKAAAAQATPEGRAAAEQAASDAQADLRALEKRIGPMVPLGEVVFVPALPATVAKVAAVAGADATGPLLTLAAGDLVIRGGLTRTDRSLVRPGQPVEIVSEVFGDHVAGTVESVGEPARDPDKDGPDGDKRQNQQAAGAQVTVRPAAALDPRLADQDVRLTIESASTGNEVLVVPLAAITVNAERAAQVVVVERDGRERRVTVTAGVSGGGHAQVTPVGGALAVGDRVVVGR